MSFRTPFLLALLFGGTILAFSSATAQQVSDSVFTATVAQPTYERGTGPVVLIDEAHNNLHTASGRYRPFAEVLRADGYVVRPNVEPFIADGFGEAQVLVIANALHASNLGNWTLPTPSAFTDAEIAAVRAWVEQGGALLLIADHMPYPGAAEAMGAAFGFMFTNGFVTDGSWQPIRFTRAAGTLRDHPITNGASGGTRIDSVATFTGQAFRAEAPAQPLLVLDARYVSLQPERAWTFTEDTPRFNADGWYQGAVSEVGQGRVAVFGEAAMFTAQQVGEEQVPVGLNAPAAAQNQPFLLNVLHWLTDRA